MKVFESMHILFISGFCFFFFLFCLGVGAQEPIKDEVKNQQIRLEQEAMLKIRPLAQNWLNSANDCEELAQNLLKDNNHRVESDFMAALIATLRGEPTTAMDILQGVINKGPTDKAPNFNMPASIMALLWKGTLARHHGDFKTARDSYKQILAADVPKVQVLLVMMSHLYLAEIETVTSARSDEIVKELELVKTVTPPDKRDVMTLFEVYRNWAEYLQVVQKSGSDLARESLKGNERYSGTCILLAMHILGLDGTINEPRPGFYNDNKRLQQRGLELAVENRSSQIDRSLALLLLAYFSEKDKEWFAAATYSQRLYDSDTFLSPEAGLCLLRVLVQQEKKINAEQLVQTMQKRYPGYKEVVEKWWIKIT